jgi:short-subunit dehydrogenase
MMYSPFVQTHFSACPFLQTKDFDMKNNFYALITGSSSGIGRAMAFEFAKLKYNILLVALPETGIRAVAGELTQRFDVHADVLELDLTHSGSPNQVFSWCKENHYQVQILVNNAGFGNLCALEETDPMLISRMLALNNHALVALTQLFISDLKRLKTSYILNVGSLASFIPIPNKAVYAASKSFVYAFSAALRVELKHLHIHVSCLCPGGTLTNQQAIAPLKGRPRGLAQTAEEVAKEAVLKLFKKKEKIIPGWHNRCLYYLTAVVPSFIRAWVLLRIFSIKKSDRNLRHISKPVPSAAFALIFR